ncbi:MAG: thioredoxin-dependent thiol peroxidase [Firmicutes bacterium]|nr:thioredoxin-dependent thiol peroxidase [Erysipelotrichaceae bacterium]MDD7228092.1 thioredoxin-dependent thiol peroxidase [Bacillota bacterium]MDY4972573.1 thioredoxin-dependent thiol peroxidase [Erysipelotrichaceae bacterium]MDY5997193.1 thioredoxin-dependent thiol peroxidase [Erysipelotrichaceae bacterium]
MLKEKDLAIDFSLPDASGKMVKLSDFKGKKIVLYFYPKDNTPGCTKQACSFRDNYHEYLNKDVIVIGISKDSVRSHSNFAQKYELPFILLSDENQDVIKAYDVLKEKKLYGKTYMGVVRTTFLISEDFHIMKVFEKVKPEENALEILACL